MRPTLRIPVPLPLSLCAAVLIALTGCGGPTSTGESGDMGAPADLPETAAPEMPDIPEDAPVVAFLGDSVTAGLHLAKHEAWPSVLQRRLAKDGMPFHVVNGGVSGDTTAGGLSRVAWLMKRKPKVVVVALGGNDGLRGISLDEVESNLRDIVAKVKANGATPLLLGYRIPPNYGPEYAGGFDELYPRLAEELDVPFVPFFMKGVAGEPDLNLPDGIHPTPEGQAILAENVADALRGLLQDVRR